jgi:hypothetical protein
MALINFDLTNASQEFRKGFKAAIDFFDGVPQGKNTISYDFSTENHVGITIDDGGNNDNRTYKIMRGKLKFDSFGVER